MNFTGPLTAKLLIEKHTEEIALIKKELKTLRQENKENKKLFRMILKVEQRAKFVRDFICGFSPGFRTEWLQFRKDNRSENNESVAAAKSLLDLQGLNLKL